jgi:uncharacterized lipoprotein NlpE involved in copper resistance
MKKNIATALLVTITIVGCNQDEQLVGIARPTATLSLDSIPADLEARVLWLVPVAAAQDGVLDVDEGDIYYAGLKAAQGHVGASLPADFLVDLKPPADEILITTEQGAWASAIVVIAAPAVHEEIAAGNPIARDAAFGLSSGSVVFGRGLGALAMATGARDGFQLIVPNPDAEVLACVERNNDRWENAPCEPCEDELVACDCAVSVDEEFCAGQATVFQSMSETLAVDIATAGEVLRGTKNEAIRNLFKVE